MLQAVTLTVVGVIVVVAVALFMLRRRPSDSGPPDALVLEQMRKGGCDLSKSYPIEFFLYFPSESAAKNAATQIRGQGFEVSVDRAAEGDNWLCFATKTMRPDLTALVGIRAKFEAIASSLAGDYDGWGVPVGN